MKATTINEVLLQLDEVILHCKAAESNMGFFAVLYRKVTKRISDGIANNEFEDNARMEKLDVIFANRYLDAYREYAQKSACTQSWHIAFTAAKKNNLLILQHLLLGINAHINLDLGITAAETMNGDNLENLKSDFYKINAILGEMVDEVQDKIGSVSPIFKLLDPLTKNADEMLANFTIGKARDGAWSFATTLFRADDAKKADLINDRDKTIALLATQLANPRGKWTRIILRIIRFFATKKASTVMEALA